MDAYPIPDDLRTRIVPGMEIDSHFDGHTVHLLAYGIRSTAAPVFDALAAQRSERRNRMERMIARLNELGLDVSIEDVASQAAGASSLGRPHLARALVSKGHVENVQDAFNRYIADEGNGYVALERLTAEKMISLIHASGGVAVVAHPMRLREAHHLQELCELGADGIEVLHPSADSSERSMLADFARERGLLVTGGSDFHSPDNGYEIGVELDDAHVDALLSRIATLVS